MDEEDVWGNAESVAHTACYMQEKRGSEELFLRRKVCPVGGIYRPEAEVALLLVRVSSRSQTIFP